MSLAETQQLFSLLTEIDKLLEQILAKTGQLERQQPRTEEALRVFNKLEAVMLRVAVISRKIAGSEDANTVISKVSEMIIVMRQYQLAAGLIAGGLATGGVLGALTVAGGIGALALTELSLAEGY